MRGIKHSIKSLYFVDDARRTAVIVQTTYGSRPSPVYYILLGLSVLIAGIGLIANSPAVVIGAMLVSPLMTPIFGVALGLTLGDGHLLRTSLVSMVGGVVLAIVLGMAMGLVPIENIMTREVLARTTPTLLDLLVAAFAGLAGCIAMLNEDVSPILPGIAIATALVPPLAACGLCLSVEAYKGAWGAFLLFFANVLTIYLVAAASFILAGFTPPHLQTTKRGLAKRFALSVAGLLVVAGFLTNSLVDIAYHRSVFNKVQAVMEENLRCLTRGALHEIVLDFTPEGINVLARVFSAKVPSPQAVTTMQDNLRDILGEPVHLYVSCQLTRFVSATGSHDLALGWDKDGEFMVVNGTTRIGAMELAEQALREILGERPSLILQDVDVQHGPWGRTVLARGQSLHKPTPRQVSLLENHLRERLQDPYLRLVILYQEANQISTAGLSVRMRQSDAKEATKRLVLEKQTATLIHENTGLWADDVQAEHANATWTITARVAGARLATPKDAAAVELALEESAGEKVRLVLWSVPAVGVTRDGYRSEDVYLEAKTQTSE